jgi:pullulanase
VLIVAELDGQGYPGAGFEGLMVLINVSPQAQSFGLASEVAAPSPASRLSHVLVPQSTATVSPWRLHPVQASAQAADARVRAQAKFDAANGRFVIPARSAVVFVR